MIRLFNRGHLVSIHAPAGGATITVHLTPDQYPVSIHAPAGGATAQIKRNGVNLSVSIHAPAGGATFNVKSVRYSAHKFQSTRPRGARHRLDVRHPHHIGFNPRARGGRDVDRGNAIGLMIVSIHAPAGGATFLSNRVRVFPVVSIHAPAGGATRHTIWVDARHFVSIHAPAGGATANYFRFSTMELVSIHAPAGGATSRDEIPRLTWQRFNPRARGGRDA